MNKKNVFWILLCSVFLIVFNIVFFVASGTKQVTSVWISYAFIHLSYFMLLATPFLIRKSSNKAVLGFPLYLVSSIYLIVTFIVGLMFIFMKSESYKACLITHVIIAGVYAVILIVNLIANENTADSIERHEMELRYVKDASARLKDIMDSVNERELRKKVEKVYDLVHSSQYKSNNSVRDCELKVLELIDVLKDDISNNDISAAEITIGKIELTASERNRWLKCEML